jgi:2-oxoglutarate ferredoxin oxidoreductase subunit alpha
VGEIFAKCLVRSGYSVFVTQTYESRVRGGHNVFALRFGPEKVSAPQESIDLLVALTAESIPLHRGALAPQGLIIAEESFEVKENGCLAVPYKKLTDDGFFNVAALGVVASLIGLEESGVAQAVEDYFGAKSAEVVEKNRSTLTAAYRWTDEQPSRMRRVPAAEHAPRRLVMNGHEAVALGAISGGIRFCSFYPMSPSTSVAMTLIQWSKEMGLLVEQVEDEIAAMNMAIGASFAGAPSLVPTSGGGFALMVEAVSLAAITETPVVVLIGQRPGPATGLATRTEQGELGFVLHAGHGEFPRAIFAPGTLEECFHLTRKATEIAEKYQGPAFILTDHFMADSYRDVEVFDVENLPFVVPGADPSSVKDKYRRYAITENGVSPRLLPGASRHLVVADSHEHTETGHITEDLTLRPKMVEKRMRKEAGIRSEVVPPHFEGPDNPQLLLVSWGSSKGAVEEAAQRLLSEGTSAASLHFSQVWPMVAEQFLPRLEAAQEVICVEGNFSGQLAQLIRRETGFTVHRRISRYDGLAITPEYILRELGK